MIIPRLVTVAFVVSFVEHYSPFDDCCVCCLICKNYSLCSDCCIVSFVEHYSLVVTVILLVSVVEHYSPCGDCYRTFVSDFVKTGNRIDHICIN